MFTISAGLPKRPVGLRARRMRLASSSLTSQSISRGVSTGPGQIAFERTPFGPNWTARLRVSERMAPLDDVYASCGTEQPRRATKLAMLMLDHARDGEFAAEENAADVDGHHLVPDRHIGVHD